MDIVNKPERTPAYDNAHTFFQMVVGRYNMFYLIARKNLQTTGHRNRRVRIKMCINMN